MESKVHPAADRFWAKVHRPDDDGCWLWTGAVDVFGYGKLFRSKVAPPHFYRAHRLSWEINVGPIPDGLHALHHCDTPRCVNPRHLYLGTPLENARDRTARGRLSAAPGERNGRAKLTDAQVAEIRARYAAGGITQIALAHEYGVIQPHISRLVRGEQR